MRLHVKEYTIVVRVTATDMQEFPSIDGFVNGLNDALPDDWFSATEGDDYAIDGWQYDEANNPEYLGSREKVAFENPKRCPCCGLEQPLHSAIAYCDHCNNDTCRHRDHGP